MQISAVVIVAILQVKSTHTRSGAGLTRIAAPSLFSYSLLRHGYSGHLEERDSSERVINSAYGTDRNDVEVTTQPNIIKISDCYLAVI
jgi:hypothetical protein